MRASTAATFRLQTLGALAIRGPDGPVASSAARRRSLALLALATSSGPSGISSERVIGFLWPEFDSERARNNLKQVVFSLRASLGSSVFVRDAQGLRANEEVLAVDLWEFERCVAAGQLEEAVALYTGEFLEGFHLPDLEDFARWIESERIRVRHVYLDALEKLAAGTADAGQAIRWWRLLTRADRLSDRYAEGLIRALADSGDVAGAIQTARMHETLVRQELELEPGESLRQLTMSLRRGPRIESSVSSPAGASSQTGLKHEPTRDASSADRGRNRLSRRPGRALSSLRKRLGASHRLPPRTDNSDLAALAATVRANSQLRAAALWRRRLIALAIPLVIAISAIAVTKGTLVSHRAANMSALLDGTTVVVQPFRVHGDGARTDLGEAVADLLVTGLDGALGLHAIRSAAVNPPAARSAKRAASNARNPSAVGPLPALKVSGDVVMVRDGLRISAEITDQSGDTVTLRRASVEGQRSQLFELADRLAGQILATRVPGGGGGVNHLAPLATGSLEAMKAFFAGQMSLRNGEFSVARDAFLDALRLDSTFALANYRLSTIADILGEDDLALQTATRASQQAWRLPNRQRRLLIAYLARQRGDAYQAERLYTDLTTDYPTDDEGWMGLAETLFHLNPLRGRSAGEAAPAFQRVVEIDPQNFSALVHLARIAVLEGHPREMTAFLEQARSVCAEAVVSRVALHVISLGGFDWEEGVGRDQLERLSSKLPGPTAVALLATRDMEELADFGAQFSVRDLPPRLAGYGLHMRALAAASHGKFANAMTLLDSSAVIDPSISLETRASLASLSFAPLKRKDLLKLRNALAAWHPAAHPSDASLDSLAHSNAHPYLRQYRLGLLSLRLQDTSSARRIAIRLAATADSQTGPTIAATLAASLRARLAASWGRPAEALEILEKAGWSRQASATRLEAYDRLFRAGLLEQLGRADEALAYYRQLGTRSPHELPLLASAERGIARILDRKGERREAAEFHQRAAARLQGADAGVDETAANGDRAAKVVQR